MPQADVFNIKGENRGKVSLADAVFYGRINKALLYEVITIQSANKRSGTACTKTRGEVSGGGRKPYKQKGTGNARAGSNRSPLFRHGGVTFGPKPRSYKSRVNKEKKRLAIISSLTAKLKDGQIIVLDSLELHDGKSKTLQSILKKVVIPKNGESKKINRKILIIVDKIDDNLKRSADNIPYLRVLSVSSINVYDIVNCDILIATRKSCDEITQKYTAHNNI